MDSAKLKSQARKQLNGNYPVIILGLLLFILLGGCCNFIADAIHASWISGILMFIISSLVMMGFVGIILKIARKQKTQIEEIFDKTDLFDKYIIITVILGAVSLLMWVLEFLSFKSLIMIIRYHAELNIFLAVLLVIFGLLLSAAILMVSVYLAISFSQTYFVLHDNPKLKISEILIKSFDMMADYVLEYFILVLSFIGWMILGLFTFGLLYIWLIPYMLVTFALFYDKVKADYETHSGDIMEAKSAATVKVAPAKKKSTAKSTTKTSAKKPATTKKTTTKAATKKASTTKTTVKKSATKATKSTTKTEKPTTKTAKSTTKTAVKTTTKATPKKAATTKNTTKK